MKLALFLWQKAIPVKQEKLGCAAPPLALEQRI
jgi:hypothetical protein